MAKGDISTELKRIMQDKEFPGVVDLDRLITEIRFSVDLSHMTIKDLQEAYIKQSVIVMLNEMNYFSPKYGKGIYVNPEALTDEKWQKAAFVKLVNKKMTAAEAAAAIAEQKKRVAQKTIKGQMAIDFENNRFIMEVSEEDFLQALIEMAE